MNNNETKVVIVEDLELAIALQKKLYGDRNITQLTSEMEDCKGLDLSDENDNFDWHELMLRTVPTSIETEIKFSVEETLIGSAIFDDQDNEYLIIGWCKDGPIVIIKDSDESGFVNNDYDIEEIHFLDVMLCDQENEITVLCTERDNYYFASGADDCEPIETWMKSEFQRRLGLHKNGQSKRVESTFPTAIPNKEAVIDPVIKEVVEPKIIEKRSLGTLLKLT